MTRELHLSDEDIRVLVYACSMMRSLCTDKVAFGIYDRMVDLLAKSHALGFPELMMPLPEPN